MFTSAFCKLLVQAILQDSIRRAYINLILLLDMSAQMSTGLRFDQTKL